MNRTWRQAWALLLAVTAIGLPIPSLAQDITPPEVASITGRVTDIAGRPVEEFCVFLFTETEAGYVPVVGLTISWDSYAETDATGYYRLSPVHPGNHRVLFRECGFFGEYRHRYQPQWYDQANSETDAKTVLAVGAVAGINAVVTPY